MLSVSICDISGKYHSSNGFVFLVATNALGIEAASFASHAGRGAGIGNGDWERGREMGAGRASKDIAESPTASPERPH